MMDTQFLIRLGVAAALGFVVGLQREQATPQNTNQEGFGGVRTFPIVALLGCLLFYLGHETPWLYGAGLISISLILVAVQFAISRNGFVGLTSQMALLLTYGIGGVVGDGRLLMGSALAIVLTLLLTLKVELHKFARSVSSLELLASLKLAVVSAIVLPLLPNKAFGPENLQIFNPFQIWLLVVMISAIGWVGYILVRLVGSQKGIGLTGFLGGLASSTALTVNFTQRSKENPSLSPLLALGIIVAWTVMYVRVLAIVWLLSPQLGRQLLIPMLLPVVVGLIWSVWLWIKTPKGGNVNGVEFANPFELVPALKFVAVIMLVLVVSRLSHSEFGDSGLLVSSFLAGLADVDAIAISVGQLSLNGDLGILKLAAIGVLLATIANTIAKGGIAWAMGSKSLRFPIGIATLLMVVSGLIGIALKMS